MAYLLDEDIPPTVAEIGRGHGLDVQSVHEIGRRGLTDREQLALAAADRRIFVTRNRDDFIRLTVELFQTSGPHHGVLIVPRSLPGRRPAAIAGALQTWDERRGSKTTIQYVIDFLG